MSIEPSADADTIKKAFRREIARYHPDKVIHLGLEFQEMAATRAAELTVAYKTLSDPAAREQYDAGVVGIVTPPAAEHTPPPPPRDVTETPAGPASESDHADVQAPADSRRRFEGERADLEDGEDGQRELPFGELLADDGRDAARVATAGYKGAELDDGSATSLTSECGEGVFGLLGEEAFAGEWTGVEGEPGAFHINCGGRVWKEDRKSTRLNSSHQ